MNAPSQNDAAAAPTAEPIMTEAVTSAPATEAATTEADVKAADEVAEAPMEEKWANTVVWKDYKKKLWMYIILYNQSRTDVIKIFIIYNLYIEYIMDVLDL